MTHTNYTTNVLHWFREISQIPRESGNEQGISDFLMQFAKDRGLEAEQDEELNVIIRANATAGYENHPSIIYKVISIWWQKNLTHPLTIFPRTPSS